MYGPHRLPARWPITTGLIAQLFPQSTSSLPLLLLFTIDIITIMITFLYLFSLNTLCSLSPFKPKIKNKSSKNIGFCNDICHPFSVFFSVNAHRFVVWFCCTLCLVKWNVVNWRCKFRRSNKEICSNTCASPYACFIPYVIYYISSTTQVIWTTLRLCVAYPSWCVRLPRSRRPSICTETKKGNLFLKTANARKTKRQIGACYK